MTEGAAVAYRIEFTDEAWRHDTVRKAADAEAWRKAGRLGVTSDWELKTTNLFRRYDAQRYPHEFINPYADVVRLYKWRKVGA